jgi:acyl-CoA synthetase (AMP-forming)/AMP-acid ligase II
MTSFLHAQTWTYAEFDDITDNVARNLLAAGLERGDRVAIHLLNGPEFTFASIGCLKAGCLAVPINTRLKGREIDYILRHSGSACYVGQPELYAETAAMDLLYVTGEPIGGRIRAFDELLCPATRPDSLPEIAPDNVAAILYRSGATAHPKGVTHSHRGLTAMARAWSAMQDQVGLITTSMAHVGAFAGGFCLV